MGSQRAGRSIATRYPSLLTRYELECSMSAKGHCYDNACAENFFHSLEVEAIHGERFETRNAIRRQVFEDIESDDRRQHRHSALGMIRPEAFEARMIAWIGVHQCWARSMATMAGFSVMMILDVSSG